MFESSLFIFKTTKLEIGVNVQIVVVKVILDDVFTYLIEKTLTA